MKCSVQLFLVQLKNNSVLRKKKFFFPFQSKISNILRYLYIQGLIKTFLLTGINFSIYLRYLGKLNFFKDLQLSRKHGVLNRLSYKTLCRFSPNSKVICLSTSRGLLSLDECLKLGLGGFFIFSV
jgi:ribosomal protein S8